MKTQPEIKVSSKWEMGNTHTDTHTHDYSTNNPVSLKMSLNKAIILELNTNLKLETHPPNMARKWF